MTKSNTIAKEMVAEMIASRPSMAEHELVMITMVDTAIMRARDKAAGTVLDRAEFFAGGGTNAFVRGFLHGIASAIKAGDE